MQIPKIQQISTTLQKNIPQKIARLKPDVFSLCKNFELEKCCNWENFRRIKLFDNLNTFEKKRLFEILKGSNDVNFYPTIMGYKPACLISDKHNMSFINRIMPYDKQLLDFVHYKHVDNHQTIILNRELVTKVIEENKDLYTYRLKLNPDTPVKNIYKALLKDLKINNNDDLLGITLGFPRKDSMIFALEQELKKENINPVELRKDIPLFKTKILEILNGEHSPYKANNKIREELQECINKITLIHESPSKYYKYIKYTENPDTRINEAIKAFDENFSLSKLL